MLVEEAGEDADAFEGAGGVGFAAEAEADGWGLWRAVGGGEPVAAGDEDAELLGEGLGGLGGEAGGEGDPEVPGVGAVLDGEVCEEGEGGGGERGSGEAFGGDGGVHGAVGDEGAGGASVDA